MDSIFTIFLLFLAALVALISYLIIPYVPVVTLMTASAIALAAGIWWHWTQFAVDYRTSTWQEQLRSYASYAMLLLVILLSYAFYVFAWQGSPLQGYAADAIQSIRDAGGRVGTKLSEAGAKLSSSTKSVGSAIFSGSENLRAPPPAVAKALNMRVPAAVTKALNLKVPNAMNMMPRPAANIGPKAI